MARRIRMGMIGGGLDAYIGSVHRRSAFLDGEIELVCGAFSSSYEKSLAAGAAFYLPQERVYCNFEQMIEQEKALPDGIRMDFVSIVTPNHLHFAPAKLALENGFHVLCDKPMTINRAEALELKHLVHQSGLLFGLTHTYTGYPLVKQAKQMIAEGVLGKIRKVIVEYPQGWLSYLIEGNNKQAAWRTSPSKSGKVGSLGDIGTHAENLAEYITGLKITELCADLSTFVVGRDLDDDANILLKFDNGAKGVLHNSQIANGEENDLNIRIYGEHGGLKWRQMEPNSLYYIQQNKTTQLIRTGVGDLSQHAQAHTRLPGGHSEGYEEAFGNIYRNFAFAIRNRLENDYHIQNNAGLGIKTIKYDPNIYDYPTVADGVRSMEFIDTVLESNQSSQKWTKFITY